MKNLRLSVALALSLGASVARPVDSLAHPPSERVVQATEALLGDRLRVSGKPGDFTLHHHLATAVVSRNGGQLVDFWPSSDAPASVPQLGGLRGIDGLWQLEPELFQGITQFPVKAARVFATRDSIEAEAMLSIGKGQLSVRTAYRLDLARARIVITTVLHNTGTRELRHLHFGDAVKWGNVDYFVDGVGRAPREFSGQGRWVGRRGASGDLKLTTLEPEPMRVGFKPTSTGFAATIHAAYRSFQRLEPGRWEVVQRALAYEPLDVADPPSGPFGTFTATMLDELGKALPSKLTVQGRYGTPHPNFGNDGNEAGAARFVWSGTGRFERSLPVGRYQVLATAGPERDLAKFDVTIRAGQTTAVAGALPRVVPTPGWLSADLHLHQAPSVDADIAYDTRVLSVAAEGVEFAVATDHYVVTDLGPTSARLMREGRLASPVRTMVGTEISTVGHRFGHFNVFPIAKSAKAPYENTTPHDLFRALRDIAPGGVIQVNHPRMNRIGYFEYLDMDPSTGKVPTSREAEFATDFDALEVFNGLDTWSHALVRRVMNDWLHQLDHGHRYTATGNSDSHKLFFEDPGLPRNMIYVGPSSSDEADRIAPEARILQSLKSGRVIVTSGPMIEVDIDGKGPGETVTTHEPTVPLRLRVRAAPWIDVSNVAILSGHSRRKVLHFDVPRTKDVLRLDRTVSVPADRARYYVVLVTGRRPLPNVYHHDIKPLAFSNPIWVVHESTPPARELPAR